MTTINNLSIILPESKPNSPQKSMPVSFLRDMTEIEAKNLKIKHKMQKLWTSLVQNELNLDDVLTNSIKLPAS
jgi:hypothetical protein